MNPARVRKSATPDRDNRCTLLKDALSLWNKLKENTPEEIPNRDYLKILQSLRGLHQLVGSRNETQMAMLERLISTFTKEARYQGEEPAFPVAKLKLRKFAINIIAAFLAERPKEKSYSLGFLDTLFKTSDTVDLDPRTKARLERYKGEFHVEFTNRERCKLLEHRERLGIIRSLKEFYSGIFGDNQTAEPVIKLKTQPKGILEGASFSPRRAVSSTPVAKSYPATTMTPARASAQEIRAILEENSDIDVDIKSVRNDKTYLLFIDPFKIKPENRITLAKKLFSLGRCLYLLDGRLGIKDLANLMEEVAKLTEPYQMDVPKFGRPNIYQHVFNKDLLSLAISSPEGEEPQECLALYQDADRLCSCIKTLLTVSIKSAPPQKS